MTNLTLIKQYTPPTCTLEILAPRPQWSTSSSPVGDNLSFQLHFDDPRLPEHKQLTIQGNREQLKTLVDLVSEYSQSLLRYPPDLSLLSKPQSSSQLPHLEAINWLEHRLVLGNLAPESPNLALILSPSQLVDLTDALTQYQKEQHQLTISPLVQSSQRIWGLVAGVVAVMGLTFWWLQPPQDYSLSSDDQENTTANTVPPEPEIVVPPAPDFPEISPTVPPSLEESGPLPTPGTVAPPGVPRAREVVPPSAPSPPASIIESEEAPRDSEELPIVLPTPELESRVPEADQVIRSPLDQVRIYFEPRWQPQTDLSEKVEYRLLIDPDGKLVEIIPLGQLAVMYQDRVGFPPLGTTLVNSGKKMPQHLRVRLILYEDGTVQTLSY